MTDETCAPCGDPAATAPAAARETIRLAEKRGIAASEHEEVVRDIVGNTRIDMT